MISLRPWPRVVAALFFFFASAIESVLGAEPDLVNIKALDPTIMVDLRYGGSNNVAGRPLYVANMPALVRPEVARRLMEAQTALRAKGFGLKIWDAYRPKAAHEQLWQYWPDTNYVASPADGGSLHTWGVAVDATLVDEKGRDVKMPTDFDDFTPAAMLKYNGNSELVRRHLHMLQRAMGRAGFYGLRTEWWHFISKDWKSYQPVTTFGIYSQAAPNVPTPLPGGDATKLSPSGH